MIKRGGIIDPTIMEDSEFRKTVDTALDHALAAISEEANQACVKIKSSRKRSSPTKVVTITKKTPTTKKKVSMKKQPSTRKSKSTKEVAA